LSWLVALSISDRVARSSTDGHPYIDRMATKLVSVAARNGADLVVVGGSTEMGFTPAMLR